jgi:AAA+ superfamily predicted ATPase
MALDLELEYLTLYVKKRLDAFFNEEEMEQVPPLLVSSESKLYDFKNLYSLNNDELVVLLIGLLPHVNPSFFDKIIQEYLPTGGEFPEIGGVKGVNHRGVLPTGETVQFILAGNDFVKKIEIQNLFRDNNKFHTNHLLWLEAVREGEPLMSGRLILAQNTIDKILTGKEYEPRFGLDFPARKITTKMEWEDVVLNPYTKDQILHISTWLQHSDKLREDGNLNRRIKPGYRVLLYGPPGTGKSLTASLLGKQFNKDVYRIDLSQIVSKFIGETEKNLENVFRIAENRDWILFFDEADALFGKRTNVQSSHDKYANQEVSYLLQRVEDYEGLLILCSNFKNNLDDAFIRRFHEVVHFPMPNANERKTLWTKSLPENLEFKTPEKIDEIAQSYELSGASILNAVQYAALRSYARGIDTIEYDDLVEGVRKEFMKEEKTI